ncbi:hypothetical protein ABZ714_26075 [Streptomyces sp. NPDC006798]|uniref:hypothetical protein n=1 Tax=Streptomyces sp. NPDC006798 TaxID=3155462 RepID=UPI0033F121A1
MRKMLESAGGLLIAAGAAGTIRELTGWFPFMGGAEKVLEELPFLDDRPLFGFLVLAVVGFVLVMVSESGRRPG